MADFSIHARSTVVVHLPQGSRLWSAMLLRDPNCGEKRCQLTIEVEADTTNGAKDVLRLVRERLTAGLAAVEEDT